MVSAEIDDVVKEVQDYIGGKRWKLVKQELTI
jgi:acetaldehyde dehydrogenase (acetylating)